MSTTAKALAAFVVVAAVASSLAYARDLRTGAQRHFARSESDDARLTQTLSADTPAAIIADLDVKSPGRTRSCVIVNRSAVEVCWFKVDHAATCTASVTCDQTATDGNPIAAGSAVKHEFSGDLRLCGVADASAVVTVYCDDKP